MRPHHTRCVDKVGVRDIFEVVLTQFLLTKLSRRMKRCACLACVGAEESVLVHKFERKGSNSETREQ